MASGESNVPQWKRDLIQRRRQQNKQPSNGVKFTSAFENNSHPNQCTEASRSRLLDSNAPVQVELVPRGAVSSVSVPNSLLAAGVAPVACNMRLEADVSLCLSSEDPPKLTGRTHHIDNVDCRSYNRKISRNDDKTMDNHCVFAEFRQSRIDTTNGKNMSANGKIGEECESDSSEELQYGPGIVNRLKSKYLNLTLREGNKPRSSVQRFRRAASLEDLLDCEDDTDKACIRKFAKKTSPGVAAKSDRYRNATRGNDSMKRARSVETLMRYQCPVEDGKFITVRQEPVNDHIVLIDRTVVKIENRLMEERPKALNKPKRLKPLLAETERPPPDLVKTTMRIFEGSVKKLKPKGDVAAKVATFKTINDTFKAQAIKKIIPKPPIQPKPFINGSAKIPGSPKKILITTKLTNDIIQSNTDNNTDEYINNKNDDVVIESIVQSVSSVVSKFQQIEKIHSPSSSPEPTVHKLKFSPTPSPEPSLTKFKDITAKTPPLIATSPQSPKNDNSRLNSLSLSPTTESPTNDLTRQLLTPETEKFSQLLLNIDEILEIENQSNLITDDEIIVVNEFKNLEDITINNCETVDGPRTISKIALDNISKAGSTFEFNFDNDSTAVKSYLPGALQNGQSTKLKSPTNGIDVNISMSSNSNSLPIVEKIPEVINTTQHFDMDMEIKEEITVPEKKVIGAISSLGLIKTTTTTTTTSYAHGNDTKTIKSTPKTDTSPPQKQIGIIRPLVSTKTQLPQQNLSNRELEKNLINRVKSIEQPTKVVVSLKTAEEIQPVKKSGSGSGGGLWDTKPWNQQNNTMVFNFSNRKDVPDYIENDGLIIRRKREKPKVC